MTPVDVHLFDLADAHGVAIDYTTLRDDRDGEYIHAQGLIRLRPRMTARLHRCVLAHELGHAAFGDVPSPFGLIHSRQEQRAEEWGALHLISPENYAFAEQVHSGHLGAMALELGVMRSTLDAYQSLLARIGNATYLDPRMGAGQWAHRETVN